MAEGDITLYGGFLNGDSSAIDAGLGEDQNVLHTLKVWNDGQNVYLLRLEGNLEG